MRITAKHPFYQPDLPAELRNRIYEYALIASANDDPLCVCKPDSLSRISAIHGFTQPSDQLRAEMMPINWGRNHFFVGAGIERVESWLAAAGRVAVASPSHLRVPTGDDS